MMRPSAIFVVVLAVLLNGCVDPGRVSSSRLADYQRAMRQRSPQQRPQIDSLDAYRNTARAGDELSTEPAFTRRTRTVTEVAYRDVTAVDRIGGTSFTGTKVETVTTEVTDVMIDPQSGQEVVLDRDESTDTTREQMQWLARPEPREPTVTVRQERFGLQSQSPALLAGTRRILHLPLGEALVRALKNNPSIAVVSYDPAISRQDMIAAAGAFDPVVFADFLWNRTDDQVASLFGGGQSDERRLDAGVRQNLVTGGSWALTYSLSRQWDTTGLSTLSTRFQPRVVMEVNQPLLRNAWPDFALAELRLARISRQASDANFRQTVEQVVTSVISSYWALIQARQALQIQEQLLARTAETLNKVQARMSIDATAVQIKQSEAAVASRRAALVRARKQVLDLQNTLGRLISDPQLNLLTDLKGVEVLPATPPVTEKLTIDPADQLLTALAKSPQLQQVRLGISRAEIGVTVAENQVLPQLDLSASAGYQGLAGAAHEAHENLGTLDYFSYSMGVSFEYPLGNRARQAELQKARFQRLQAISSLQDATDQVGQTVRERIRGIAASYEEMLEQRQAVQAAKLQLQALQDTERIRGQLTPEFLQLKLSAQETLATAQLAELAALIDYNVAIIELNQATGALLDTQPVRIAVEQAAVLDAPGRAPGRDGQAGH